MSGTLPETGDIAVNKKEYIYICPGWCGSVVECQTANQRVTGSIPSRGHIPGLQARSRVGGMQEATTH